MSLYTSFRGWAEEKGLDPNGLPSKDGVIPAAAYDASKVADPTNVVMTIEELEVDHGSNGTMAFTVSVEASGV